MVWYFTTLKPRGKSSKCLLQPSQPPLSPSFKTIFNPKWISSHPSHPISHGAYRFYLRVSPTISHLHHSSPGPHLWPMDALLQYSPSNRSLYWKHLLSSYWVPDTVLLTRNKDQTTCVMVLRHVLKLFDTPSFKGWQITPPLPTP